MDGKKIKIVILSKNNTFSIFLEFLYLYRIINFCLKKLLFSDLPHISYKFVYFCNNSAYTKSGVDIY